jgi:hypothetical protein
VVSSISTLCLTDVIVAVTAWTELVDLVTNGTFAPANQHERRAVDEHANGRSRLRGEADHERLLAANRLATAERQHCPELLVVQQRCREGAVPHRLELRALDGAVAVDRIDDVARGAIESLVGDDWSAAKRRQIELDDGPLLVRLFRVDLNRPHQLANGRREADRAGRGAGRELAQHVAAARRGQVLFDDFVGGLCRCRARQGEAQRPEHDHAGK